LSISWYIFMHTFLPYAFFRWEFIPFQQANISIATHALHYGTGAFWGMRGLVNPKNKNEILLFRLENHAQRLAQWAKFLGHTLSPLSISQKIVEFVQKNAPKTGFYIRPLVYTSDLDISPRLHNIEYDFFIYGIEFWEYLANTGVKCSVSSFERQSDTSFPLRGKIAGGYITSALAKTQAHTRGFDEAILLNAQGKVSEWSAMNLFLVRNGKIITPWVNQDILEGITRDSVIQFARHLWYEVEERSIDQSELFIADEVFLTGTAAKITPVTHIEQYILPTEKPISTQLKAFFDRVVLWEEADFEKWITKVQV